MTFIYLLFICGAINSPTTTLVPELKVSIDSIGLIYPIQVTHDSNENIIIVDLMGQHIKIHEFDRSLNSRSQFAQYGRGPHEFQSIMNSGFTNNHFFAFDLMQAKVALFKKNDNAWIAGTEKTFEFLNQSLPFYVAANHNSFIVFYRDFSTSQTSDRYHIYRWNLNLTEETFLATLDFEPTRITNGPRSAFSRFLFMFTVEDELLILSNLSDYGYMINPANKIAQKIDFNFYPLGVEYRLDSALLSRLEEYNQTAPQQRHRSVLPGLHERFNRIYLFDNELIYSTVLNNGLRALMKLNLTDKSVTQMGIFPDPERVIGRTSTEIVTVTLETDTPEMRFYKVTN